MVAFLVSQGAAPGALTDPSPDYPLGRTPADLASANGHKGISGFLAESSLTDYLKSLTMNDRNEDETVEVSGAKAVQTVSERTATPVNYGDAADALSLRDSLTALCNATQAAGRIHQMFRMYSLQRKRTTENDDDKVGLSDERALSLLASKMRKPGRNDGVVHAAATQIQKKFRGWKKRKEFLIIRQRIVKIQVYCYLSLVDFLRILIMLFWSLFLSKIWKLSSNARLLIPISRGHLLVRQHARGRLGNQRDISMV